MKHFLIIIQVTLSDISSTSDVFAGTAQRAAPQAGIPDKKGEMAE